MLEGRANSLAHGYYCTRPPDDDQRQAGITPSEARDDERRFFRMTDPWTTSTCPDRYGTHNLVKNISELIIKHSCVPPAYV